MNTLPPILKQIAFFFESLPGIGEKTANRLAFYLLRLPESELKKFSQAVANLKKKTKYCQVCLNLTENDRCPICQDKQRDQSIVTVVESVLDLLAFENGNIYKGVYHVLHGRIDPLNNIRPEDIYIDKLIERVNAKNSPIKEIILATNTDMEGEATAMYIKEKLKTQKSKIKITRLAYGLPIGANLEYADYGTLKKAIDGRQVY
ncbi:MAG: recombination mediator RecR [Microgenomates group bacterium]|nr:recombination mediator RecR [Microgenomates group bacterium]